MTSLEIKNQDHAHRQIIVYFLKQIRWMSLVEVGCGIGENLVNIVKHISGIQLGGVDNDPKMIEKAQSRFKGGVFNVCSGDNIMMSDNASDIILTDMMLVNISPPKIKRYIKEFMRVGRNYLLLCELHEKNPFKRLWLRIRTGLNSYNYVKLLNKLGCYDIMTYKFAPQEWEEEPQRSYGNLILAKIPKYK